MPKARLTISSKNYSSWSLRGWLLCRMAGLDFETEQVRPDDIDARAELLLLSPSLLVPRLVHDGVDVWDTLAIAEYLAETFPDAHLLPSDKVARQHCRSVSGEMHSGFYNLRSALPMNLKARYERFKVFTGAKPDIERIKTIWGECIEKYGGPFLFGAPTMADAMFAPVATRFRTYGVQLEGPAAAYCEHILAWPVLKPWIDDALDENEPIEELDMEF